MLYSNNKYGLERVFDDFKIARKVGKFFRNHGAVEVEIQPDYNKYIVTAWFRDLKKLKKVANLPLVIREENGKE